jgi:hypothetical protein
MKTRTALVMGMILAGALYRVVPHPHNFAPITAMALFGAAHFERRWMAFTVPLAAMFLSDLGLEFLYRLGLSPAWGIHSFMGVVYGSFLLMTAMGLWLRGRVRLVPVAGTVLASSVVFFLVTNLGVWWGSPRYPQTLAGLLLCFTEALPWFQGTLLGDVVFGTAFFGGLALAERTWPSLREPVARPANG